MARTHTTTHDPHVGRDGAHDTNDRQTRHERQTDATSTTHRCPMPIPAGGARTTHTHIHTKHVYTTRTTRTT